MRRDLPRSCARVHDLVIVGGGVSGACIARDAALRGLSVALIEKQDFSHATSAASSKLIHGGLRYLKNLEVGLIRESLRERRMWLRTAPHLVYPLMMLLPTHRGRSRSEGKALLRLGLSVYDLLAFDRGWLADPDQRLPGHRALSRAETLALQPDLPTGGLTGALQYYDCQMFSPERLALECLLSAAAAGAQLCNYTVAEGLLREGPRVVGVQARDLLGGEPLPLRGRLVINAAGPWADLLLAELRPKEAVPVYLLNLAWLDKAASCANKRLVIEQMEADGDPRVLPALRRLSAIRRRGCGFFNGQDCFGCLRETLSRTIGRLASAPPPAP